MNYLIKPTREVPNEDVFGTVEKVLSRYGIIGSYIPPKSETLHTGNGNKIGFLNRDSVSLSIELFDVEDSDPTYKSLQKEMEEALIPYQFEQSKLPDVRDVPIEVYHKGRKVGDIGPDMTPEDVTLFTWASRKAIPEGA